MFFTRSLVNFLMAFCILVACVVLLFSQTASAKLVSILNASEDRSYFFFENEDDFRSVVIEVCGEADSFSPKEIGKEVLIPAHMSAVMPNGEQATPAQELELLERLDTTGESVGFDPLMMGFFIQQMNKVYVQDTYDQLPQNLQYAELGSCLPGHVNATLRADYIAPERANCFNSALHFYDARPIEFLDEYSFADEVAENFEPLADGEAPAFGHLGVVYENDVPFHAFVVISGNWAYTKNGKEPSKKHRLQRITSIEARYFAHDLRYFRKK
jgi:hypothetical protein